MAFRVRRIKPKETNDVTGIEEDLDRESPPTMGQKLAETVAKTVGSWWFIAAQSAGIIAWITANALGVTHYDPYPFILLNLTLSLQAAYTAPMILMAQNRQNEKDRRALYGDYETDVDTNKRITRIESLLERLTKNNE